MSNMEAVNGLLAHNDYINTISSNIANASTIGYKSIRPVFFNIFSHSLYSNSTMGCGVGISNFIQNFNNGMLIETGRDLDLGILEDGFFRVVDAQGHVYYTRDGQFLLDKNKNIVNMQGMYLTGQNESASNNTFHNTASLQTINLQHAVFLKEKPTSEITLKAILNSNTVMKTDGPDDNLSKSEDYKTYINVYNKDGHVEKINISFNKKDQNIWNLHIESDDFINNTKEKSINSNFDVKFDSNGELVSEKIIKVTSNNTKYENIKLNLTGTREQADIPNSLEEFVQNGYSKGSLNTFNIAPNGEIIGMYSNNKQLSIGQILLSKFINPEKLQPETGNIWSATEASGTENVGVAGNSGFGIINVKTLEASNVDLNKELINMIIAQRNYQSNAQSFKTEDKIIHTLLNL